MQKRKSK